MSELISHPFDVLKLRKQIAELDGQAIKACDGVATPLSDYLSYYGYQQTIALATDQFFIDSLIQGEIKSFVYIWLREHAKGTVIVAPGLFDHVGIYQKFIAYLLSENFSVLAIDMPGHGLSEGERAEIGDFSEYVTIIDACLEKFQQLISFDKLIMLGQSTGGAAVAHYLLSGKFNNRVSAAILLAPLLRPTNWAYVNSAWLLAHYFIKRVPRRFAVNSNDEHFLEFLENRDCLQPKHISLRWVGAMREWIKTFPKFAVNATPILILQGDDDGTVDWKYNLPIFESKFCNAQVKIITGARHHLVNEAKNHFNEVKLAVSEFLSSLK